MDSVRDFGRYFELLKSQVAFADPCVDRCQVGYNLGTLQRVLCNRRKFDRPPAFTDCVFFSAQSSVDESQANEAPSRIRPCLDKLLLHRACDVEGGVRRRGVSFYTTN